jgi:hypothetical protein
MKLDQSFMAQLLQTLTNQYGGKLSIRKREGKIEVIKSADMSKRVLSEKQKWMNIIMKTASVYAKNILSDEKLKDAAQLRLNVSSNQLYHALVGEYFQIEQGKKTDPYNVKANVGPVPELQINQVSNNDESNVSGSSIQ